VFGFTDPASIKLLIVIVTGLVTDTPVAPVAGLVETTLNEPLPYVAVPVVNELVNVVTVFPPTSLNPPTDTLYSFDAVSAAAGTNVSVTPSAAKLTVPAIALPPEGVTVIELFVIDVGSIVALITATTSAFNGTPVCVFAGLIVLTVACVVSVLVPVQNVEVKQLPPFPAISVNPHRYTSYCVFGCNAALGVIVALNRFAATVTVLAIVAYPW
jgi:hypothetical protein